MKIYQVEKKLYISVTGKTNAAKSAGSGTVLFWCKIKDVLNNKVYKIERARGQYFAVGINDVFIGSVDFIIKGKGVFSPKIEVEAGYIYDSGYTGSAVPVPSAMKKTIILTPFGGV